MSFGLVGDVFPDYLNEYNYPYLDPLPKRKPQTNADRIRAMSDEELAKQLYRVFVDGLTASKLIDRSDLKAVIEKADYRDWLKSEAKEASE